MAPKHLHIRYIYYLDISALLKQIIIKIGIETSDFLTGKTSLKNIGNCYTYVYKNKEYYIKLVTDSRIYIFNLYSKDDTINL